MHRGDPSYAGQAAYTRWRLRFYDAVVHGFNGRFLWRCPKRRLVGLYDSFVSGRHLDIGVGTGCLLDECRFPVAAPQVTLMDLNPNPLEMAARRLGRYAPGTHRANVLESWDLPPASYDSIGMAYLLHCLPGTMSEKAIVFEHARFALAPGGVLFGATVLGEQADHTPLSRAALHGLNRRGVFSSLGDTLEGLDAALASSFDSRKIDLQGAVALFSARMSG